MKVIISHDVDHLTVTEHFNDLIIPKFIARSKLELLRGRISLSEFYIRMRYLLGNKWQCLEELMDYNEEQGIPATFFLGVNNGKGLAYSLDQAGEWIRRILERGFDAGVHGIAYTDKSGIDEEYRIFKEISGLENFGIRMHYLRKSEETLTLLEQAGYLYDSSVYEFADPYLVGGMLEFPLHIMDGYIIEYNSRHQSVGLERAKELTSARIEEAEIKGCRYLNILFHDRYFNRGFKTWMSWYIWLTEWLIEHGYEFMNFREAIIDVFGKQSEGR